jgi:zinc protease
MKKIDKELQEGEIFRFKLSNGLDVVLMKDSSAPLAAVNLWYKVGSKDEQPGKSGFAHLFEHMMFQGSENVGKAEHMKLISDVGGWMNGTTSKDRTNYFEVVPANQLRLAFWLEADRMRSLAVNEDNFENQRSTVKEERRLRVDNAPYAPVFYELLDELAYQNWAYKHSVIGSMKDLDKAALEDVIDFHNRYYKPNNAVLAIVGHFDAQETVALIKEYFEDIPTGEDPPDVDLNEPDQTAERHMVWRDRFAPMPAYACAYHIPKYGEKDYYTLELIEKILFDGESSRLYRTLVEEHQAALHLFGGVDAKIGPSVFMLFAQIAPGHTVSEIDRLVENEIIKLRKEPVSGRELQKVKNKCKAETIAHMEKVHYKADLLCKYTAMFDDPKMIYNELERYISVTAADIVEAANRYFQKENRSLIEVVPVRQNADPAQNASGAA